MHVWESDNLMRRSEKWAVPRCCFFIHFMYIDMNDRVPSLNYYFCYADQGERRVLPLEKIWSHHLQVKISTRLQGLKGVLKSLTFHFYFCFLFLR